MEATKLEHVSYRLWNLGPKMV